MTLIIDGAYLYFYRHVQNIHLEGKMSHNFDIGHSFDFMSKKGNILIFFS